MRRLEINDRKLSSRVLIQVVTKVSITWTNRANQLVEYRMKRDQAVSRPKFYKISPTRNTIIDRSPTAYNTDSINDSKPENCASR